jgi:hypothetical protein
MPPARRNQHGDIEWMMTSQKSFQVRHLPRPGTGLHALAIRNQRRTYFTDEVSRKAKVAQKSVRFEEGGLPAHPPLKA